MFNKWCEITSCNGVVDLYEARTHKAHFAFWALLMVSMTGASVFFTYRTIQGYLETPTVTNVAMARETILDLPEVLICFNGGFNVEALKRSGFDANFTHTFSKKIFNYDAKIDVDQARAQLLDFMAKHRVNMKEFIRRHSFTCEDIIKYDDILFLAGMPEPCTNCSGVVTFSGNCYVYEHNRTQFYPGPDGGLKLKLRIPSESYASVYPSQANKLGRTNSFTLYLEKKFGEMLSDRFFVVPGESVVSMTLNTKRYVRTGDCDSRSCVTNSNSCFNDCWLQEVQRKCNCTFAMFSRFVSNSSVQICNVLDGCGLDDFTQVQECQKTCLPLCDEWVYESTVTYGQLQRSNATEEKITIVNIAYNSMQYTRVDNVAAFTIDMAIANVGGQAGLWLGVSIVTIIQAFYYLVLGAFRYFSERKLKTANNSDNMYVANRKTIINIRY